MQKQNIVLIGFMGTGKTVTGDEIAKRTSLELVDMDSIIEDREKRSISDIFATAGEKTFRKIERELVKELSQREGLIISTGGGVVLDPDNITDFEKSGLVVCLTASPSTIFERLEHDTTRPLLSGDKKNQISELFEARKPLYGAIKHQINGDIMNPAERAEEILRLYNLEQ